MAAFVDRFSVYQGILGNPNPSGNPIKFYELRKIIDGKPQPIDEVTMHEFKACISEKLADTALPYEQFAGFSIVSDGFGGLFTWGGKRDGYNVLYETPFIKRHSSGAWECGDFDEMGIECIWYGKVMGKENDLWAETVVMPGTPPDIEMKAFEANVDRYIHKAIPDGPLFIGAENDNIEALKQKAEAYDRLIDFLRKENIRA